MMEVKTRAAASAAHREETDMTTRRQFLATTLLLAALPLSAAAQAFPEKPVTLVVGFSAGGGTDSYARALAAAIAEPLGVPVLVVNQEGAAGMIAAQAVAGAAPDGYTLYMASAGSLMVKAMYDGPDAAVQPLEDLAIVGQIGASITGLLVPADSPFQSAADLVAAAEADPSALRWSHPGRGSLFQLSGVAFLQENGIAVQDVPFQGGGPARNAVAAGQVDFGFMGVQLKNGFEEQIRALGVAGDERDPANPDVPTFAEQGLPEIALTNPQVIMAPMGVPEDVLAALVAAVETAAGADTYAETLNNAGLSTGYREPETARARLEELREALQPLVDETRG
jgi:tripartite-type tricarboxylate transporter receptor subunit TctC